MADDTAWCGDYCSLAFDSAGYPAIAYYEMRTHSGYTLNNLKFTRLSGDHWQREVIASTGDIGLYDTLCFDGNDQPVICSYSNTDHAIHLFH